MPPPEAHDDDWNVVTEFFPGSDSEKSTAPIESQAEPIPQKKVIVTRSRAKRAQCIDSENASAAVSNKQGKLKSSV